MKKYHEEYFTVREKRTHKKICDCGNFEDAIMMLHLDVQTREIIKNKILMDQVIDVEIPKALPTNEIVVNMDDGVGGSWRVDDPIGNVPGQLPQIKLPDRQAEPVIV